MQFFYQLSGWQQALIACTFTWAMTAAGASLIFFFKNVGKSAFALMVSVASGIMVASSFFSLLLPALESGGEYSYIVLTLGFIAGGAMIIIADIVVGKLRIVGDNTSRSCLVTCVAVTVHNIPEGMAVGVAFGAAAGNAAILPAAMLALGIGIQNFPEGMCVALPLRANGCSRFRSFFIGQLSGMVEIVSGVLGAAAVTFISWILSFALAFSAGAMIAVVCSELVPKSCEAGKALSTLGVIGGFALMMILDIAFG